MSMKEIINRGDY
jgi:hypothetical protein